MTAPTIVEFLLARIAEDEAIAREALAPANMHPYGDRSMPPTRPEDVPDEMRGYLGGPWGEHAARWDMTRALAECAAKRAIVALHPEMFGHCRGCADETFPCRTLLALTIPYANHPDYQAEGSE